MMWAQVEDNLCIGLTAEDPDRRYEHRLVWLPVPHEIEPFARIGYVVVGGEIMPPTLADFVEQLKEKVKAQKKRILAEGVIYNGVRYHTDAESRGNVLGKIKRAELYEAEHGPGSYSFRWKAMDATPDLCLTGLIQVGIAVADFAQACIDREDDIGQLLTAAASAKGATWRTVLAVYHAEVLIEWPNQVKLQQA